MLRPELPAGEPGAAACVVRLPDGRRVSRRFRPGDDLDQLFAWVASQGGGGAEFGPYNLVRAIPRPCQTPDTGKHMAPIEQAEAACVVGLAGRRRWLDSGPYNLVRASGNRV